MSCQGSDNDNSKTVIPSKIAKQDESIKPLIYFGFISRYNPRIMYEEYQPFLDYLTENTPYRFELKLGKSYEDAVQYLCDGEVQIASLGAVTYLEAHKQCGAEPIVRPVNKDGKPFYHSIVIVRNNSPLYSLADLGGHSFAFASIHSTSGNLIPRYDLVKAGISIEALEYYENLKHHDTVAKELLAGRFDAGAVKDNIAYGYLKKGLRVLHKSAPIPSEPIVARPDCDPEVVAAIKQALLESGRDNPSEKVTKSKWNEEFRYGFIEAFDSDYAELRRMINEVPQRCAGSCHPAINL
jgi:phosphonate transport system substrate-binding protein